MGKFAAVRRSGLGRGVWNIADQVISSANSFIVQIAVAQWATDDGFGAFAVIFAIFSVSTGFFRAFATQPVGMRFAGADDAEFGRAARSASGLVLTGGVLLGVVLAVVGLLVPFPGIINECLIALGIVLPGLLMQDAWRQVLFARLRPAAACVIDGLWCALQLAAVVALFALGESNVVVYILAWGGTALAASFVGLHLLRMRPRVRQSVSWVREQASLTRYLVPEFVLLQSGANLAVLIVAAVATEAAAGALRGANMLTVPATILSTGLMSFAIPELVKRRERMTHRGFGFTALAISGLVTVTGAVWGSLFLLLPDGGGHFLLKDSWAGTREVLVPIIVGQAGAAMSVGAAVVLYATEGAKATMRVHTVYAVLLILLSTIGAIMAGAVGTAWGSAAAFLLVLPGWFVSLRRHIRSLPQPGDREPSVPVD